MPFGDFSVSDRQYDKLHFRIHDYFIAKTIDKVRTGGIIAFITTSGTLDKKSEEVRKYINARCDLIGAVRLPNNTFKANAGTEAVADILFLQKRDRILEQDVPWLHLSETEDGIPINGYFAEHPEMACGEMQMVSGPYGPTPTCVPTDNGTLEKQLDAALQHLQGQITKAEVVLDEQDESDGDVIEADPDVRNYSFTMQDGKIYYRENSIMRQITPNATAEGRIKSMIAMRDTVRDLIQTQLDDYPDEEISRLQGLLNRQYDAFHNKYGLINSRGAAQAFQDDSGYFLLCSLEDLDDEHNYRGKTDMFYKRTIRAAKAVDHVDTATEALALSIGEEAKIDFAYMEQLTGKTQEELVADLTGVIFRDPLEKQIDGSPLYLPADEYLSGDVRHKLAVARQAAENDHAFAVNVQALEQVQPKDLEASEIAVRLGATWIDTDTIKEFADELVDAPYQTRRNIRINYVAYTGTWNVTNKSMTGGNIKATVTYGTSRANFYHILEESLNLRAIRIFDIVREDDGEHRVLNSKATQEAQEKQRQVEEAFKEWIFKDQSRRKRLVAYYNEQFNSTRPREYDGSHIQFHGMNPGITLRPHQKNAIAHILYGHNTLLAHVVGAGKTFEMVAAAMEKKRLGLCSKTMICVPNHLTEQLAAEALLLYPNANILVAKRTDFEKSRRKRFCAKIATGNYDIIVIGHSQFERIPLSQGRQMQYLQDQISEIMDQVAELKAERAENFTIKQMERMKKQLQKRLEKLNDISKRELTGDDELPGATLTIQDKDGNAVREWVSTDKPTEISALHFNTVYTLTETRPADGYALADSIKFKLVQKQDETSGAYLNAADVYVLTGKDWLIFNHWEVMQDGMVVMRDDTTKVQISKQDITSHEELSGAHLTITDESGKVVEDWTSTDKPHYIEKLPAGKYTLTEVQAPNGYDKAESIIFEVLPIGTIQTVTMYDRRTPPPPSDTPEPTPESTPTHTPVPTIPQTGDNSNLGLMLAIFGASVLGLAGMAILHFHNRKSNLPTIMEQEDKPEELAEDADEVSDNDDLM